MRLLVLIVTVSAIACSSPFTGGDGSSSRFDGTLGTVYCRVESGLKSAPCVTYAPPSHRDYVDSGRVIFESNGTVRWMLGTHTTECPCYLGGCTDPCYDTAPSVSTQSGTYTVSGDSIVLQFTQGSPSTLVLTGTKDSLECDACTSFYPVVLKSP